MDKKFKFKSKVVLEMVSELEVEDFSLVLEKFGSIEKCGEVVKEGIEETIVEAFEVDSIKSLEVEVEVEELIEGGEVDAKM